MRVVDLKQFQSLVIPRNQGELLRGLSQLTLSMGAARFAYIQLPNLFALLDVKVSPRILTNFPGYVLSEYVSYAHTPFSLVREALHTGEPVFTSDGTRGEELRFQSESTRVGYPEIAIFPINGSSVAAMCYAFDHKVERSWASNYYNSPMKMVAKMAHMAIVATPELCPPFQVPGYTARVQQILRCKVQGMTNHEIGVQLGIKSDTVKKALRRLSDRLGGLSTSELIYHTAKLGLL